MYEEESFRLYGIFGHPLSHTLSPAMQEAAFAAGGIKAFYLALDIDSRDFKKTIASLRKCVLDGFNITVPYKETVMPYLDRITPEARAIGAVNTVFKHNGRWTGANTDGDGFLASLRMEAKFNPKNKKALVIGAGGAARAVVYGLAGAGANTIWIANRHLTRAQKIAKDFRKIFSETRMIPVDLRTSALKDLLAQADLVVNATSVGLKPAAAVLPETAIPKAGRKKLFYDLVYHRKQTEFLMAARKKGHRTLGGLGMLLFQGAKAFEHWTGKKAPVAVMRKALIGAWPLGARPPQR